MLILITNVAYFILLVFLPSFLTLTLFIIYSSFNCNWLVLSANHNRLMTSHPRSHFHHHVFHTLFSTAIINFPRRFISNGSSSSSHSWNKQVCTAKKNKRRKLLLVSPYQGCSMFYSNIIIA